MHCMGQLERHLLLGAVARTEQIQLHFVNLACVHKGFLAMKHILGGKSYQSNLKNLINCVENIIRISKMIIDVAISDSSVSLSLSQIPQSGHHQELHNDGE